MFAYMPPALAAGTDMLLCVCLPCGGGWLSCWPCFPQLNSVEYGPASTVYTFLEDKGAKLVRTSTGNAHVYANVPVCACLCASLPLCLSLGRSLSRSLSLCGCVHARASL
jgi:hypothetical protein